MVLRKTVCLRRLGGDRGGELQAGRFFANPKVTAEKPLPEALKAIGTQLVMKVGGASGPLHGNLSLR